MVGLLGIQKSGAAYVPLDPYYPAERMRMMLDDAQVPVLLTQQALLASMPEHQAEVICLDSDWPQIAQESSSNPSLRRQARRPGLRDLHLGFDGQAQGGAGTASRGGQPAELHGAGTEHGPRRRVSCAGVVCLRHVHSGAVPGAGHGRTSGGGATARWRRTAKSWRRCCAKQERPSYMPRRRPGACCWKPGSRARD